MKKIGYYILVLAAVWVTASADRTEIGDLIPVEIVEVRKEESIIKVTTDTGNVGLGESVKEAFEDLKATTAGVVYLDTADFVLLEESAVGLIPELCGYVKQRAAVCLIEGEVNLKEAAGYLTVHNPKNRINSLDNSEKMEILKEIEGRMCLYEKR